MKKALLVLLGGVIISGVILVSAGVAQATISGGTTVPIKGGASGAGCSDACLSAQLQCNTSCTFSYDSSDPNSGYKECIHACTTGYFACLGACPPTIAKDSTSG